MKRLVIYFMLVVMLSCSDSSEPQSSSAITANISIKNLIASKNPDGSVISEDVIFEGRVITSDSASNFYNSFIVDDGTGAIEIMCGFYDIHDTYKFGGRVIVRAKGLTIARTVFGVWRLGFEATSIRNVEYLGHRAVAARYITFVPDYGALPTQARSIDNLDAEDVARMVCIDSLRSAASKYASWVESGEEYDGIVKFVDRNRDTIRVKTSRYALFARRQVPKGECSVTGILLRDAAFMTDGFYLKMNDENGVKIY